MVCFPNAKINIGLNILNRRADGYHNLETILYPVRINDALEVIEGKELSFISTGLGIPGTAEENLCVKAFHLLKRDYNIPFMHIHLHKHIPIGAGLGGGSADAACFIKTLNEKFKLNLSADVMEDYCRHLGADCPFFIHNIPVFASGIGDVFTPVTLNLSGHFVVLVMPPVSVSTYEAYRGVIPAHPEMELSELGKLPIEQWKYGIKNDFEESIFKNHPQIRGVKSALYEAGALYASMSGSGSSVYGIFSEPVKLDELEKGNQVFYGL